MLTRLRIPPTLAALAMIVGASACTDDGRAPNSAPTQSAATTSTPGPTESVTPEPAWQDQYTAKQLEAYGAALARFQTYEHRASSIWAEGEVTERAEALFKQYFPSPVWQSYLQQLETYESVDVHIDGVARVYWSRAKSVSATGLSVVVTQCVDYSQIRTSQRGQPAKPVAWQQRPNLRTINLEKPDGYGWLIYGIRDATDGKAPACAP